MSMQLESPSGRIGTKFKIFPQLPSAGRREEPETVWVSAPAGSVGPGPADERFYVIDPVGKERAYGINYGSYGAPYLYLPPWDGPVHRPVQPNEQGHFDHLEPGTPEFEQAHVYGSARFALDVWEGYFGRRIAWHFGRSFDRLEVVLLPDLDNAYAGYGSMEIGSFFADSGEVYPFSLNFDVISHEIGHMIIYSEVGLPATDTIEGEYFGFHESAADLVALLSMLHFNSEVDELLEASSGNLYTYNELNRFAELSKNDQIRLASNPLKLSDFADGWTKEHDLAQPLTGAMFDILVDIFHENLLERGLISPAAEDLADQLQRRPEYETAIQELFDEAYVQNRDGFKRALLDARDILGYLLAETWRRLSPDSLNYVDVAEALLAADRELAGGSYQRLIRTNLDWREIGAVAVGPRRAPPDQHSHVFSARTAMPPWPKHGRKLSFRERWEAAHAPPGPSGNAI
jgi:hypothetical protein